MPPEIYTESGVLSGVPVIVMPHRNLPLLETRENDDGNWEPPSGCTEFSPEAFIALCDRVTGALLISEGLVRRGADIVNARRPWWKKLFRIQEQWVKEALEQPSQVRQVVLEKRERVAQRGAHQTVYVDHRLLEGFQTWLDLADELRAGGPYR